MATTISRKRWRFPLIGAVALIAMLSIVMGIIVSSGSRGRKLAVIQAAGALQEGRDVLVSHTAMYKTLPGYFDEFQGAKFLNKHFEIRPGATVKDVADGVPAVLVKSDSQWLLEDPEIAAQLGLLNAELAATCRKVRAGSR